jgi:hypothetical protein
MKASRQYLERCAAETGFGIGPLEKVVRLGELAGDIARHPLLGSSLVCTRTVRHLSSRGAEEG